MGVDAEMFVRIKGREKWLSEEQVRRLAYELASSVGHDNFLQIPAGELGYSKPRRALSIVEPFANEYDDEEYAEHVGKPIVLQDGPPVVADDDEQFIKVSLFGRYYGEGYERGDWPTLRSIAEWLEARLPGSVWYGGDSSGILAKPLDEEARRSLTEHWILNGNRPYVRYGGERGWRGSAPPTCPLCEEPMTSTGGGSSYDFWYCDGCGRRASVHVSGEVAFAKHPRHDYPVWDASGKLIQREERR